MGKFIQTQCLPFLGIILVCTLTLYACNDRSYSSPEGYDLRRASKMQLSKELNEISGLTYKADSNTLLAVSDSKQHVFEIDFAKKKSKNYIKKFADVNDYEDLVLINNRIYILISNGTLLLLPLNDSSTSQSFTLSAAGKNDFETLYYDPSVNSLVVICKSCASDKGKFQRSAYRFDLTTNEFDSVPFFNLNLEDVKKNLKNDDADFKPSAAALHPINKRLYVLGSSGNLLVIADNRGQIIEVYNLNPDEHPQAEGIAFAPNGDMYISNEGKYGTPTLQIFPYREQPGTKK